MGLTSAFILRRPRAVVSKDAGFGKPLSLAKTPRRVIGLLV
jgi:hypothetical protein